VTNNFCDIFGIEHPNIETKICIYCKEGKILEEFQTHLGYKDKLDIRCKDCIKEQNKLRRKLKRYAPPKPKMCVCCGKPTDKMVLDHCHITLKFRGWLCINCNMGIGKLGDNIEGVMKAVMYLKKSQIC
jgi:hypothetical protein|tara:strand:- start:381 stop:767 length:387 start_codon:yes stop_codon:yes gene_type:complete